MTAQHRAVSLANSLLEDWPDCQGLPPFQRIHAEHFEPAFALALRAHADELGAIASQSAEPDFDNTIAAFDRSGRLLVRIEQLFYTLTASVNTPELQVVQRAMAMPLAAHSNAVFMNRALFARVESLYQRRATLALGPERLRMLERTRLDFVRAGALLEGDDRRRYAALTERLAELNTQFAQHVLADENSFELQLRSEADLQGLPGFVRDSALQAARERGHEQGVHLITLSRPAVMSFLSFSARRDLREQVWRAWVSRGEQPGATDNRAIVAELLALRQQQAELLGYACYADYALADTMAGSRAAVQALLDQVWEPAKDAAAREAAEIEAQMQGCGHALQAWDWRYYAEQVRQTRYAVNAAELKAYFPLDAMVEALFDCADRLFGLRFELLPEAPSYHPDVKVYQVRDADGSPRGLFLHDNFARTGKRSGAWMNALRWQSRGMEGPGSHSLPIILNTNNFAKPAVGQPALLAFDEARTLFHEFGHGLHGLLSEVEFERLSGTQVLRDFVELPSQIFEHWLSVPEVLKRHARHWQSGEPISDEMLARLKAAERFNQGYDTVRYCASALVDLAAHGVHPTSITDISAFELEAMKAAGLPEAIGLNHRLCHFQHLFSGSSYAAGYYVYLWAEVLDCDAYEAFAALGDPFDPALAEKLRSCILSVGNSREPGQAFRDFRGRDPRVEPMLRERGLLPEPI